MEMFELIGTSFVVTLFYALAALLLLFLGLRWLDSRNERPWKEAIEKIRENEIASAIYYAARWIGACLLVGMVMSR
jgi:high-affinity Fe2+/Pb2+ permease